MGAHPRRRKPRWDAWRRSRRPTDFGKGRGQQVHADGGDRRGNQRRHAKCDLAEAANGDCRPSQDCKQHRRLSGVECPFAGIVQRSTRGPNGSGFIQPKAGSQGNQPKGHNRQAQYGSGHGRCRAAGQEEICSGADGSPLSWGWSHSAGNAPLLISRHPPSWWTPNRPMDCGPAPPLRSPRDSVPHRRASRIREPAGNRHCAP